MKFKALLFSLCVCANAFLICPAQAQQNVKVAGKSSARAAHQHASTGPHQGDLLEVGQGEYHLEICVDEAKKGLAVYLLAEDAKSYIAIGQQHLLINVKRNGKPYQYKLIQQPQEFDEAGFASRYSLTDLGLFDALHDGHADARVSLKIGDKAYNVKVRHEHHHSHGKSAVR